jgi:hypothetical protein
MAALHLAVLSTRSCYTDLLCSKINTVTISLPFNYIIALHFKSNLRGDLLILTIKVHNILTLIYFHFYTVSIFIVHHALRGKYFFCMLTQTLNYFFTDSHVKRAPRSILIN